MSSPAPTASPTPIHGPEAEPDDAVSQIADLKRQLIVERMRNTDGIYRADVADLRNEGEILRDQLALALKKLGQAECSECGGDWQHYYTAYGHDCAECMTVGFDWL